MERVLREQAGAEMRADTEKEAGTKGQAGAAVQSAAGDGKSGFSRRRLWERELLDFSLRNTLLNFRVTQKALQLMAAELTGLEDALAQGRELLILEALPGWTQPAQAKEIRTDRENGGQMAEAAREALEKGRLRTFLEEAELEKHLKELYRSARMSMEENGTNTLYLALGFLRWFEDDRAERARYAPLVLVPVELVKRIRGQRYLIRSRQEEAQVNITLLEYLRQEYGVSITGLDPLPEDEHGLDLSLIFQTVRRAVGDRKRWEVEEIAFLGLFSFGQFVMWNDIHSRGEELERSPVVSGLLRGEMDWTAMGEMVEEEKLEQEISVKDTAVPLSADASQLAAVCTAAKGQSFVLHGPPGTGKSQTIANMIANALYHGQSVLFVAEKMAALNVVRKRLSQIGLDPFCLELHSNKTNKTTVLRELNRVLELGRTQPSEKYGETAEKLERLRSSLGHIVDAMHRRRECGMSLYEMIETYKRYEAYKGKLSFLEKRSAAGCASQEEAVHCGRRDVVCGGGLSHIGRERLDAWDELIFRFRTAAEAVGDYRIHPLRGIGCREYSLEIRDGMAADMKKLLSSCGQAGRDLEMLEVWAEYRTEDEASVHTLLELVSALRFPAPLLSALLQAPHYETVREEIRSLIVTGKEYGQRCARLREDFEESVFSYPVRQAQQDWKKSGESWPVMRWVGQRLLVKELRAYAKTPDRVTKESLPAIYEELELADGQKRLLEEVPGQLVFLLGGLYQGTLTDWQLLEVALEKTDRLHCLCQRLPEGYRIVERGAGFGSAENSLGLAEAADRLEAFCRMADDLAGRYEISFGEWETGGTGERREGGEKSSARPGWPQKLEAVLNLCLAHISELRDMAAFNQIDSRLRGEGLSNVSEAFRSGAVKPVELEPAYRCGLSYALLLQTIEEDPALADFQGKQYDSIIAQYSRIMEEFQGLTLQELSARLSSRVPVSGTPGCASSEMGILQKAIRSNGRRISLRRLFRQIPNLLKRLCPCMLMSPISVAQYLDPSFPLFDLVIFDEASQLPTSEAVGAIARGRNVVVVGDPRQLPPTRFFSANRPEGEEEEGEELESLLEDCLTISMPQKYLKWHYRSRHESLIAYSNRRYYENRLYTFPSPCDQEQAVRLIPVEGCYEKGGSRQNRGEAEAVVAELVRRLRDERLREESCGVVTFGSAQRNLIEDLLQEEFRKAPELEEWDREREEPVFVKNLENVQGDERDVILFSIGYGPDEKGRISMNFGPLNREGGWRRLNVAISRARKSMLIYSALRPEQMDLSRTRSEGVAGLKGFLEYAAVGQAALPKTEEPEEKQTDGLIREMAQAVEGMGYETRCSIGVSRLRVDIGVVDPARRDTCLLGILLDGRSCLAAVTSHDRFLLQPAVMEGLGWRLLRLWTLDWLDDPAAVAEKVRRALREAEEGKEGRREKHAGKESGRLLSTAGILPPSILPLEKTGQKEYAPVRALSYINTPLSVLGTADDFYRSDMQQRIIQTIREILEKEAPISRRLLLKKVLGAWGISRAGARVERIFDQALAGVSHSVTQEGGRSFLWSPGQEPEEYAVYRVEDGDGGRRGIEDIPFQEIRNAMLEVLEEQISLPEEELNRAAAQKLGFARAGSAITDRMSQVVCRAVEQGRMKRTQNGSLTEGF